MTEDTTNATGSPVERPVGLRAPRLYLLRYLCDTYILADAFRPQPGWGSKGYTVDAELLGEHTDEDVIRAAQQTAPQGFWLHLVEAIGGEPHLRVVFKRGVPVRRPEQPNLTGMER